ncbi:polysaccharide deacetylase family protein [Pirellulaceae bacterium SH467]|jgi:predicted glycoside hydrolase/deacetylase ChbG (UPF0249 family)
MIRSLAPVVLATLGTFAFLLHTVSTAEDKVTAAPRKYLIIHTDDAGMSHSVNMATQEALQKGIVTSASIMVPCPWFKEFAGFAKANPQFDYGIHLTLTSEWENYRWGPVSSRDQVASLIDAQGYLWDNTTEVAQHVKADEVKIELKAQIERAKAFGVPISHLDTHMGALVTRDDLVKVYVELGAEYDLPVLFFRTLTPEIRKAYPPIASQFESSVSLLHSRRLPLLDRLLQFYGGEIPEMREKTYFDALRDLPDGVTQLIIHCGKENEELRAITDSSRRRDQDREIFTRDSTKAWLDEQGITLIDWKDFHQMEQNR